MPINSLCILGTRPEAIKMAPVIKQLAHSSYFNNRVCLTGQHQDMISSILDLFQIKADYDLHVMSANQDLSHLTAKIIVGLAEIFNHYKPDCVLVHGDTTTTLAASLCAYYYHIPIIHVEAGLRTGDIYSPWPEEANRKLSGNLATLHFAPTELSRQNLLDEGVSEDIIFITGNTVIDALLDAVSLIETQPQLKANLQQQFAFLSPARKLILITGHRRENFGEGFDAICHAISEIAMHFPEVDLLYPVHLNPNVQKPVNALLSGIPNVFLIKPVDYLSFVYLMQSAYLILTDSGGIQEEAPSLGIPVLVMREKTERPEAVIAGTVKLVGTNTEQIIHHVERLLTSVADYQKMSAAINPYGDGKASGRIVKVLKEWFSEDKKVSKKKEEVV